MLYGLVRPMKRRGSLSPYFVKRIPEAVRAALLGKTLRIPFGDGLLAQVRIGETTQALRFSLRTSDPAEAKARQAECLSYVERLFASAAGDAPQRLNRKQAVALSGRLYRAWADDDKAKRLTVTIGDAGDVAAWRIDAEAFRLQSERMTELAGSGEAAELEAQFGRLLDRLLQDEGVAAIDPDSRLLAMQECARALADAFAARARKAEGDYAADPKAGRFPTLDLAQDRGGEAGRRTTLRGLLEDWQREAVRKPSTVESYGATIAKFAAFIGHDDAARVTTEDVIAFKDHRLRSGLSAKTVNGSDMTGLRTILQWGVDNRRVATNAAAGVKVKMPRRKTTRRKGFTEAEAVAILSACLRVELTEGRAHKRRLAERWVPWVQCYTGARVGEIAQLRKQDVRREGPHCVITITPEAGTVKTDEPRDVVLHPHLVDMGFLAFVEAAKDGHLFLRPAKDGDVLGPLQGLKNRLASFARDIVADKAVQPTHGWRHRFYRVGEEAGIEERTLLAMAGHAPATSSRGYGGTSLEAQANALAKFPRIVIEGA